MILNAVLCDYLRLTSFNQYDYEIFSDVFQMHRKDLRVEVGQEMQYKGQRTSHGFNGIGRQKKAMHYLTRYSGASSHLAYSTLVKAPLYETRCTRIDAQVTIQLPDRYDARKVFDHLQGKLNHGRSCTLVQGGDGLDTIYLGSRKTKNGRFTRLYVKEFADGRGLRFETEFKGEWAREHWVYLRQGGWLSDLLVAELESLGNLEFSPLAEFYALVKGFLPAPRPRPVETSNPKLDWLLKTAEPVIVQLLNDHDHGWKVRRWLENMLDWSKS